MTEPFKVWVGDLFTEFPADALRVLGLFDPARTVAALLLQTLLDHIGYFFVRVNCHCHSEHPLSAALALPSPDIRPYVQRVCRL